MKFSNETISSSTDDAPNASVTTPLTSPSNLMLLACAITSNNTPLKEDTFGTSSLTGAASCLLWDFNEEITLMRNETFLNEFFFYCVKYIQQGNKISSLIVDNTFQKELQILVRAVNSTNSNLQKTNFHLLFEKLGTLYLESNIIYNLLSINLL